MRQISAQTWVNIPDANFAADLRSFIPAAMNGNQLNTSSSLVTNLHSMYVQSYGITDLTGIQYFTSLTYLDCSQNHLTNLPTLPSTLKKLICGSNQLTSLPALPNGLTYLQCCFNQLRSLPTLPNTLDTLTCCVNPLPTLPTLPNSLIWLHCNSDSLSNLPSLPSLLKHLDCGGNVLNSIPTLPNSLSYFDCSGQRIIPSGIHTLSSLPFLPNTLTSLDCGDNNITCFPTFPNSILPPDTSSSGVQYYINIDPNPYNCLPNYLPHAMSATNLSKPLCGTGNTNGCAVAGIEQIMYNNIQVTVYPNPTNGSFKIVTNTTDKLNVDLYDFNGRHVFSSSIIGTADIDANSLANGVYSLTIKNYFGVTNKKVVIAR